MPNQADDLFDRQHNLSIVLAFRWRCAAQLLAVLQRVRVGNGASFWRRTHCAIEAFAAADRSLRRRLTYSRRRRERARYCRGKARRGTMTISRPYAIGREVGRASRRARISRWAHRVVDPPLRRPGGNRTAASGATEDRGRSPRTRARRLRRLKCRRRLPFLAAAKRQGTKKRGLMRPAGAGFGFRLWTHRLCGRTTRSKPV